MDGRIKMKIPVYTVVKIKRYYGANVIYILENKYDKIEVEEQRLKRKLYNNKIELTNYKLDSNAKLVYKLDTAEDDKLEEIPYKKVKAIMDKGYLVLGINNNRDMADRVYELVLKDFNYKSIVEFIISHKDIYPIAPELYKNIEEHNKIPVYVKRIVLSRFYTSYVSYVSYTSRGYYGSIIEFKDKVRFSPFVNGGRLLDGYDFDDAKIGNDIYLRNLIEGIYEREGSPDSSGAKSEGLLVYCNVKQTLEFNKCDFSWMEKFDNLFVGCNIYKVIFRGINFDSLVKFKQNSGYMTKLGFIECKFGKCVDFEIESKTSLAFNGCTFEDGYKINEKSKVRVVKWNRL